MTSRDVSRRDFLSVAALGATASLVGCGAEGMRRTAAPVRRPNVVVILADDLGYADLGFQGCKDIPTPHLDRLAGESVRFTDGYVSCPVCSPTRAGLLTGRYQQRFGHELNPGGGAVYRGQPVGVSLAQKTFPAAMKEAGYRTGMVGKWHLGEGPQYVPTSRGFEEFFGFLGGAHAYQNLEQGYVRRIFRGTEELEEKEHLTDAFTREAVDYISRHRAEPFFLYLAYNAVHTPMQPPARYTDRFADFDSPRRRQYAGMLAAMDEGIGRVLATLRDCGLENDTMVFFLSDNGGPSPLNASDNRPLRGTKSTTWEGGVRVPFVIRWPGRVAPGSVYEQPIISLDILPTALAAGGGRLPAHYAIDGVDLMPYLHGRRTERPHERLYWRWGTMHAIRSGDLKWTVAYDTKKLFNLTHEVQGQGLFDLAADIGESRDLSLERPDDLRRLKEEYAAWNKQMIDPLWPTWQEWRT